MSTIQRIYAVLLWLIIMSAGIASAITAACGGGSTYAFVTFTSGLFAGLMAPLVFEAVTGRRPAE